MCLLLKSKCLPKEERSKTLGHRKQKRQEGLVTHTVLGQGLCALQLGFLCAVFTSVLAREIGTGVLCWAALFRLLTELQFIKAT